MRNCRGESGSLRRFDVASNPSYRIRCRSNLCLEPDGGAATGGSALPQADELVEAGRRHVARGQVRQAMVCFRGAADDPEQGAEALSLLAATYLLPGACVPELALVNAYRAAQHPAADREHLTR